MKLLPILTIVVIVVLIGIVLVLKPFTKSSTLQKGNSDEISIAEISLKLVPEMSSVQEGEEVDFVVHIDSHAYNTYITELQLNYDPQTLSILSFEPGDFFQDADTLFKSINPDSGSARYTLGSIKPSKGKGIVANIRVKALQAYDSLNAPLYFNKNDTAVGLETADKSKIFTKEETTIFFEEETIAILP